MTIGSTNMSQCLTIGELAKQTSVKVVTVRYYERVGILPAPPRTLANYRTYSQDHIRKLHFVRRCRELGFTLDQIRDLLRLSAEDAPSCSEVCALTARHLVDTEKKLRDLNRLASELRRIHSSCNGKKTMAECRIIEALSNGKMKRIRAGLSGM